MGQGLARLKATGDAPQVAQIESTPITEGGTWRPAGNIYIACNLLSI